MTFHQRPPESTIGGGHADQPTANPMGPMLDQLIGALELTIDQRNRAVRALADIVGSGGSEHFQRAADLISEPWARKVLHDE